MKRLASSLICLFLAAVSTAGCGGRSAPSRALVGCERDTIHYSGRQYTKGEALALLGEASKENQATRKIASLVNSYFDGESSLCDMYVQGALSELEYKARKDRIAKRFGAAVDLNRAFPAHDARPPEVPLYLEMLSKLTPDAKSQSVEFGLMVVGKRKEISNGAILFEGDEVRLIIDVGILAYLYVYMIDSTNRLSLLYPAAPEQGANPVRGRVEIPSGEADVLVLDENEGPERFMVFLQTDKSRFFEPMFYNAKLPGGSPRTVAQTLWNTAKRRMSLTETRPGNHFFSPFGVASTVFEIDHR